MYYMIAGQPFETQQALIDAIRALIKRYRPPARLTADDEAFVLDLLRHHDSAARKVGAGVAAIWLKKTLYDAAGFYIERTDGSWTDFSWWRCIRRGTRASDVSYAFRRAVDDQIKAIKRTTFPTGAEVLRCPLVGIPMTWKTAQVDHAPPWPFARLLREYLDDQALTVETVPLEPSPDGIRARLPAALAAAWSTFHRDRAELRVISALANLRMAHEPEPST